MSKMKAFAIERYFARYEFNAKHLLSCSDCEPYTMTDILDMADSGTRRMWNNLKLSYTETSGHPLLREMIAATYDSIDPNQILMMAPEEGIFLLMNSLLSPGDHVICTFPGYQSLYEIAMSLGCELTFWKADEENDWAFHVQDLARLIRKDTKLVVANFPHNPTGFLPTKAQFSEIIGLVESNNAWFFSDEMYRGLEFGECPSLPPACTLYDKAVSLSGMSKAYGLPGLRTGWVATQQFDLIQQMIELKDYTTICNSAPSEILAIAALCKREHILRAQMERVRRNALILDDFISAHSNRIQLSPAKAGPVCFPRLSTQEDTSELCRRLVQETGIMLLPSEVFGFGRRHVRIGFGREDFPAVLERFGAYLSAST